MYFNLENESLCWLITKYYLIRSSVIKCQFLFFVEIMHAFFFFFFFGHSPFGLNFTLFHVRFTDNSLSKNSAVTLM